MAGDFSSNSLSENLHFLSRRVKAGLVVTVDALKRTHIAALEPVVDSLKFVSVPDAAKDPGNALDLSGIEQRHAAPLGLSLFGQIVGC
ncbi:MAG: hypothetical protein KKG74_06765 [Alphaproteobacteria bacterium]|nr:hypothetical protein [Alphaproteobacteria bacterium]